jgi:hypothetical protein
MFCSTVYMVSARHRHVRQAREITDKAEGITCYFNKVILGISSSSANKS